MVSTVLTATTTSTAAGVGTPEQTWGVNCIPAPSTELNKHSTEPWRNTTTRLPLYRKPFNNTCAVYKFQKHDTVAAILDKLELDVTSGIRQFVRRYMPCTASNVDCDKQYDGSAGPATVKVAHRLFPLVQYLYKLTSAFKPGEEKVVKKALQVVYNGTVVPMGYGDRAQLQPDFKCLFYDSLGKMSHVKCLLKDDDVTQCTKIGTVGCTLVFWDANVTETLEMGKKVSLFFNLCATCTLEV